jgi:O-succinylbenzoic acid--CoA ligase
MGTTENARYLPDWLARCAANFPQRLAVQDEHTRWSFADLDRAVNRAARQLAALSVCEDDRVALLAGNSCAYVAFIHALTRLGAILVPLNARLTEDELCWQLRDARAAMLVSDARYAERAEAIGRELPDLPRAALAKICDDNTTISAVQPGSDNSLRSLIDLDATQAIMYTSGTTGQPKGAIITCGMQWWNAIGSALNLGQAPDDRWLACLPLFHIGGLSILMRSVIYGIGVIVHERFDAVKVNRSIAEDGVTMISVVAVMLQRMLDAQPDGDYPPALRCVLLGGGPAPYPLLEECARRHIPVVQTYGLTESCSQAVTLAPGDALRKLGSAGRPLLPVQLRVMSDGQEMPAGEPGEIYLRGPTITPGYAGSVGADLSRPARAFHDGWLATGDIGYLDDEGYLYVLDRRADLIISGGENIYPAEIEGVLLSHPDVAEAGVRGQPDAQWGQVPVAFVHLRDGSVVTSDELLAYAGQRLARYKLPRAIHLVGPLPRTSAGKLLRRALRE